MVIIHILIFSVALYIASLLLEYKNNMHSFFENFKKEIIISFLVYALPKIFSICITHYFVINPIDMILIDICFCIMLITDIIERSVFTVVPLLPVAYRLSTLILLKKYYCLGNVLITFFAIYAIYYLIDFLFFFLFKKESIGFGDILCFFMLGAYHSGIFLILAFWIAALFALILFLLQKMWNAENKINHEIPFIPYLYLGYYMTLFFNESILSYMFS